MVNSSTLKRLGKRWLYVICVNTGLVALVWASLVWGIGSAWHRSEYGAFPLYNGVPELATPIYLWTTSQSVILLPELKVTSALHKVIPRNTLATSASLLTGNSGTVCKNWRDSHHYIASANIVLRLAGCQACQYLDIPPPPPSSFFRLG